MTTVVFYGVLWLEGANDVIAEHFNVPLYLTTEIARIAIFVLPAAAYIITKRICLGLQLKDQHLLAHGVETGIIRQLPNGEFIEETRPVSEDARAVLESRPDYPALPAGEESAEGVPAPGMRGAIGRVRERMYKVVTESVPLEEAHANGHGNGHAIEGNGHAPAQVSTGQGEGEASADQPPSGEHGH
jgi:ubiquinol-cytochrome c reductase cytochrome b subunit